ncbi:hypothetical protein VSR01_16305 [Actinacidiphila sp. DG2A-62]|uniref:hypothetical protein n=1 Tax=Actinacidiphila sp. DG2A-62 TaxID=3108821 RepID=UPI002DBC9D4A|nr:hypothetical protein [Actinacidiphila sp. DG2A-62]MEC3995008.1 hypothetical protein [Actinacidiphila sp. DG2A-62]
MPPSQRQKKNTAEGRREALQLHLAGIDLATIAKQLHYADASAAKKAIDRAFEESIDRAHADIDELRRKAIARYDRMQSAFWGKAVKGDPKAADIVLRIMRDRGRIEGTEVPTRINVDAQRLGEEIMGIIGDLGGGGSDGTGDSDTS